MRQVRLALLEADVNYKVAKEFAAKVSETRRSALRRNGKPDAGPAWSSRSYSEELTALMGVPCPRRLARRPPRLPTVIVLCGLQGAGKTTHGGKLRPDAEKAGPPPAVGGVRTFTGRPRLSSCR